MNGGVRRPLKGVNARLPRSGGTSPRLSRLRSVRSPKRWRIPPPGGWTAPFAGSRTPRITRASGLAWRRPSPCSELASATADHARLVSIPGFQDLPSRPFRIGARVRVRRWSAPARTGRPDPAARRRSGLLESAYRGALPGRRRDRLDRQSRHGGHGGSSLRRDLAPARVAAPEVLVRYLPPTVRGGAGR